MGNNSEIKLKEYKEFEIHENMPINDIFYQLREVKDTHILIGSLLTMKFGDGTEHQSGFIRKISKTPIKAGDGQIVIHNTSGNKS